MAVNNPLDFILSVLPTLSEKDMKKLKRELGAGDACGRLGHRFKFLDKTPGGFLSSGKVRMFCPGCGKVKVIENDP